MAVNRDKSSWLPGLIGPLDVTVNSVEGPELRSNIDLRGEGITVTDDPDNDQTIVEFSLAVDFTSVSAALAAADASVDVNGQKITDLGTPTVGTDAATKAYVDGVSGGAVPTGTGFWTITAGASDAASSPYGSGCLAFLATPSSANLASFITDETGSGKLVFGTSPTLKTTVILRDFMDSFNYTITPSSLAASRILTLPALSADDTFVFAAQAQTLTNKTFDAAANTVTNIDNGHISSAAAISVAKLAAGTNGYVLTTSAGIPTWAAPSGSVPTGSGFYTVTGGIMDASASSAAAGVLTFLATPSSANLRTVMTDETGSGLLVFGTSPTLKTTVILRDFMDSFNYTITPSSLAASRILTLPALSADDTFVFAAQAQTLTNKTIDAGSNTITNVTNSSIAGAAAVAGTKISPDFGSQNVVTTGYFGTATSPTPTSGNIRLNNDHKIVIRNNANSANTCIAHYGTGDVLYIGLNSAYGEQAYGTIVNASSYTWLAVNGNFIVRCSSTEVQMVQPVVGDDTYSSPYGCHGAVVSAMVDADYTVPDEEYKYYTLSFVCTGGTGRTVTFPHPSSLARSYTKNIRNSSEKTLTISTGTGTTVTIATSFARVFEFTNGGVRVGGEEYSI